MSKKFKTHKFIQEIYKLARKVKYDFDHRMMYKNDT